MKTKGVNICFGIELLLKEAEEIKKFKRALKKAQKKYLADEREKKKLINFVAN